VIRRVRRCVDPDSKTFKTMPALTAAYRRVLVHYHGPLTGTEHRIILYYHTLNCERFGGVSMHLISQSKSAPRTQLVNAEQRICRVR
jgi:hypothetical protein